MTKSMIFRLALVGITMLVIQRANAASAVATDFHGHTIYSTGQLTKAIAIQHALETARQRYGAGVRIIAATDVKGYGAIAVASKGNRSVLGAALGHPSLADAEKQAIEICLKGGGVNPRVIQQWNG
jgi:hypothetical protein